MILPKPPIKYTDMAIWVDNNYNVAPLDDKKLHLYLYHLVNMQAHQVALFKKEEQYEEFALYGASRLFIRLTSKDKTPIKSILNYIKSITHHLRADFEVEYNGYNKLDTVLVGNAEFSSYLIEQASHFDKYGYATGVYELCCIVSHHLRKIPKKKNSPEWVNIYISCILTFLDSLTIDDNLSKQEVLSLYTTDITKFRSLFEKARSKPPILFHLDKSMENYIKVLVQELRHAISAELQYSSNMYVSVEEQTKRLIIDTLKNEET